MQVHSINEKLYVEIYTIGYEPMGEGIIIKIKGDRKTLFCGVIDCYETEKQNETLNLVKNERIDLICLTHPDEDHCKGLDRILKLSDSNTTILYPNSILYKNYPKEKSAKKTIKEISKFIKMNKNNFSKPRTISCVGNQNIIDNISFFDVKDGGIYELQIDTYTPLSTIIDKRLAKTVLGDKIIGEMENNDLSIMMSVTIGSLKLLFCGDIEDNTIIELDQYIEKGEEDFFYDIIDYVKIPHHGSDGSKEMFKLLSNVNKVSNSVSTVYRTSRLPKKEILEMYKRKNGKVFCTGNLNKENNTNNYGIVKHTFDIINKTVKTELVENANELWGKSSLIKVGSFYYS